MIRDVAVCKKKTRKERGLTESAGRERKEKGGGRSCKKEGKTAWRRL